jgi:hypothetical protein
MNPFDTPAELRAAFDALLAATHRQLRLYDHDLGLYELEDAPRHAALRAFCVAGGGRTLELLLDDIGRVARDHPRLMQLVRDFGHVLAIRQADANAPRPDQAFVLGDRGGVLLRADKSVVHGTCHPDDPARAAPLQQEFESMWQRSPSQLSATTLGL